MKYCLVCLENLADNTTLFHYLFKTTLLCTQCQKQLCKLYKTITIAEHKLFILYQYNELIDQILKQLNKKDTALLNLFKKDFAFLTKKYKNYYFFFPQQYKKKFYFLSYWLKDFTQTTVPDENTIYFFQTIPTKKQLSTINKNAVIIVFTNKYTK